MCVTTKIQIVEDKVIVARDIQNTLKNFGYYVSAVSHSGEDAVKKVSETTPDLILMDVMLNGRMDGISAAETIKNNYDIPIIYLTSYSNEETMQRAQKTQPYGYILKPFEDRELNIAIQIALCKHKLEKKLKESESYYRALFNKVSDAVIVISIDKTNNGNFMHIEDVNNVAVKLLGMTRENILNTDARNILKENIAELESNFIAGKTIRGKSTIYSYDFTRRIPVEYVIEPFEFNGRYFKIYIAHDISERVKIEKEMLKIEKLESLSVLTSGIAHNYNNLLTGIVGNISLAQMQLPADNSVQKYLKIAEEVAFKAKDLTNQLMTFSMGGNSVKKIAAIGDVIVNAANFASSGANVKCVFEVAGDLKPCEIDESQINQVVTNIVLNSIQAMPEGGVINISADNVLIESEFENPCQPGEYVKVTIRDNGIGIPYENLSKIFDPYFTTKPLANGFGLAIAYSLIKKHNGVITVDSQVDSGTTICFYIPAINKLPEPVKQKNECVTTEVDLAGKRILILDDDESIRELMYDFFSQYNACVYLASDGLEVINKYSEFKRIGTPFDILILDLTIPGGMGGVDTIKALKQIDGSVKAIAASGYFADSKVLSDYKSIGFQSFIPKPCELEKLKQMVCNVISLKS
ncbi:MAG: response regulator [Candidatus Wallbacteria bacterium]